MAEKITTKNGLIVFKSTPLRTVNILSAIFCIIGIIGLLISLFTSPNDSILLPSLIIYAIGLLGMFIEYFILNHVGAHCVWE